MTGSMLVQGVAAARYRTFVVDEEQWPPKYWKVGFLYVHVHQQLHGCSCHQGFQVLMMGC